MKFIVTPGGVPTGNYSATFAGAEPFTDRQARYDEGVMLRFRVTSGDYEGDDAVRIVSKRFTPKSNLCMFARSLAGRDLRVGEAFDFADYAGVRGKIIVEDTDGGSTRVAAFLRSAE